LQAFVFRSSGELVAEGCQLGVAHPPGYPLYTLLMHAIYRVSRWLGREDAFLYNLTSALFGSLTSLFSAHISYDYISILFSTLKLENSITSSSFEGGKTSKRLWEWVKIGESLSTMFCVSFCQIIWQYHTTAEVVLFTIYQITIIIIYVFVGIGVCFE